MSDEDLKKCFDQADVNDNGEITLDELRSVLRIYFPDQATDDDWINGKADVSHTYSGLVNTTGGNIIFTVVGNPLKNIYNSYHLWYYMYVTMNNFKYCVLFSHVIFTLYISLCNSYTKCRNSLLSGNTEC